MPKKGSEKLTSKDLKERLASHLTWRLGCPIVCDEFKFIDLIAVRRTEYVVEFEIKISKSDLNRELRCIMADKDKIVRYGKDWEKFIKHRIYLTGSYPKTEYDLRLESLGISPNVQEKFRPSEFYFYVPDEMAGYTLKKVIELGLPYGVVAYGHQEGNFFNPYFVMKKADKLHNNKADGLLYKELAHALTARSKLLN